jgi:hypothetical protein
VSSTARKLNGVAVMACSNDHRTCMELQGAC